MKRLKSQTTDIQKITVNHIHNKGLVFKIYKELLNNTKISKQSNYQKKKVKFFNRTSPNKIYRWKKAYKMMRRELGMKIKVDIQIGNEEE